MRTWTSFPLSLWPPPHALAAGAVLGILPVPSSSHNSPRWTLLTTRPTELCWPFIAQSAVRTAVSSQSVEALTLWEGPQPAGEPSPGASQARAPPPIWVMRGWIEFCSFPLLLEQFRETTLIRAETGFLTNRWLRKPIAEIFIGICHGAVWKRKRELLSSGCAVDVWRQETPLYSL